MNFSLANLTVFGIGAILVYSAVKHKDPRDVVKEAFGKQAASAPATPANGAPSAAPNTADSFHGPGYPIMA